MRLAAVFLLSLLSSYCLAQYTGLTDLQRQHIKSISVVAPEWEDFTNTDGSGLYWDIMRAVYEPTGIKVKVSIVPWNRAIKMVSKYHTHHAIMGEYKDSEDPLIFPNFPFDVEHLSVLNKNNVGNDWDGTLNSLSHKKVGWIKGIEFFTQDQRDYELLEFRNIEEGVLMLTSGKIDFLIDLREELELAMETYSLTPQQYSLNNTPEDKNLYAAFSDNIVSKELINIYNQRIPVLVASGEMANIYKKWSVGEMPRSVKKLAQVN